MSSDELLIRATHVSKRFQLGQFVSLASTLRNLKRLVTNPVDYFRHHQEEAMTQHAHFEEYEGKKFIWALRDISFELKRGERVGILGANGAGKSTLLRVLIGIMSPTDGIVETNCRVVPLMGVGAGFNPELTGKENTYIYGSVLGISAKEIKEKYDDIVAFAEIEDFMETPVKRYSKGMKARLGMAIALSLSPEVLVVDEVLAVGDVKFRNKCMENIQRMCAAGMTLLFVSHSPARIKALCTRAILIRKGQLIEDGDVNKVLQRYLNEDMKKQTPPPPPEPVAAEPASTPAAKLDLPGRVDWTAADAPGDSVAQIFMVRAVSQSGEETQLFSPHEPVILEMEYIVHESLVTLRSHFRLFTHKNEHLLSTIDSSEESLDGIRIAGVYRSRVIIPPNTLRPQSYCFGAAVYQHQPLNKHARTEAVASFRIDSKRDLRTARSDYPRELPGIFWPKWEWQTEQLSDRELPEGYGEHAASDDE